jgi:hypothetical protein
MRWFEIAGLVFQFLVSLAVFSLGARLLSGRRWLVKAAFVIIATFVLVEIAWGVESLIYSEDAVVCEFWGMAICYVIMLALSATMMIRRRWRLVKDSLILYCIICLFCCLFFVLRLATLMRDHMLKPFVLAFVLVLFAEYFVVPPMVALGQDLDVALAKRRRHRTTQSLPSEDANDA